MSDFVTVLQTSFAALGNTISAKPELVINFLGFVVVIVTFIIKSKKELALQHRNNYFALELEASRIFTVAVQNPDIPRYLRGELDNSEKGNDPRLEEQAFWFVSQALGIFEIAVSLRNEKTITSELFVTWVPWFYELGTYDHFRKFWCEGPYALMYNYKKDLQEIMMAAVELKKSPSFHQDDHENMKIFCSRVAEIFGDRSIFEQYRGTMLRNERLNSRLAKMAA